MDAFVCVSDTGLVFGAGSLGAGLKCGEVEGRSGAALLQC